MAFGSQARTGVMLLVCVVASAAEFPVTHKHLRRDQRGLLRVDAEGLSYSETKKDDDAPHDYRWRWDDIQRLILRPEVIEITTYKDVKWMMGKDRSFVFTSKDLASAYPLLAGRLPRRFFPEVAMTAGMEKIAELPAKRLEGFGGSEGTLLVGKDRLVFQSDSPEGSHTWILEEVENISSVDPLEVTVSSLGTDYRLQLKRPLPEGLYQNLWRKLNLRSNH